jgi:hypothetical protein
LEERLKDLWKNERGSPKEKIFPIKSTRKDDSNEEWWSRHLTRQVCFLDGWMSMECTIPEVVP